MCATRRVLGESKSLQNKSVFRNVIGIAIWNMYVWCLCNGKNGLCMNELFPSWEFIWRYLFLELFCMKAWEDCRLILVEFLNKLKLFSNFENEYFYQVKNKPLNFIWKLKNKTKSHCFPECNMSAFAISNYAHFINKFKSIHKIHSNNPITNKI